MPCTTCVLPTAAPPEDAADLRVGGLTRLTTIDYPGELAAVVFCQGCAWRCRYCHNHDLLDPDAAVLLSWTEVTDFLEQRRELLDAVVFSGGEPTTQHALPAAMSEVRALGFKIGLHTNGAYPDRLRRLLPVLDWVGLDIKALPADYAAITGVDSSATAAWDSLALLVDADIALEVRTTVMPDWTPELVAQLAHSLANAGVTNFVLQACDITHALDSRLAPPAFGLSALAAAVNSKCFSRFTLRGN